MHETIAGALRQAAAVGPGDAVEVSTYAVAGRPAVLAGLLPRLLMRLGLRASCAARC